MQASNFDYDKFADTTFTFEGEEIKAGNFEDYIDAHVMMHTVSNSSNPPREWLAKNSESSHFQETQGSLIAEFQQQWQEAVQKQGYVDTPLTRVVNELTVEIIQTAGSLEKVLKQAKNEQFELESKEAINKQVASTRVHRNSETICTSGGGDSTDALCQ